MPDLLLWWVGFVGLSAVLTWGVRRYALRRGLMDAPGARRSHFAPTPRGGGAAIVLVVLAACLYCMQCWPEHGAAIGWFSAGLLLVAFIGWLDDHRSMSPWPRLAVHAVSALLLVIALRLEGLPAWQCWSGGLLALGLVNVWNFMDGINGLVASQAALAALGYSALLDGAWAFLALALCAALVGFLPFNFPRARIFLGDVGSGALGYLMAALAVFSVSAVREPVFLVLLPLLVCCIDAGFTLARRVLSREAWWQPHTTHAYQRAARRWGHARVTLACALLTAAATMSMLMAQGHGAVLGGAVMLLFCVTTSSFWWVHRARNAPKDEDR